MSQPKQEWLGVDPKLVLINREYASISNPESLEGDTIYPVDRVWELAVNSALHGNYVRLRPSQVPKNRLGDFFFITNRREIQVYFDDQGVIVAPREVKDV